MGSFSAIHWIIVGLVILILFGRGRISETMGDFGRGIKSFRKGMAEDENKGTAPPAAPVAQLPKAESVTTPTPSPSSTASESSAD